MKNRTHAPSAAFGLASILLLAGCAGHGLVPASPAAPDTVDASRPGAPEERATVKVEMRMKIPMAPRHAHGKAMRPFFVATTTQGVEVTVYAHGGTTPLASTAVGVAASSPLCTPVTGGRSCMIPASAPSGNDDFVVTSYDAQPVHGSFSGAKQLAVGKTTFDVVKGKDNHINLTLGGVVAKGVVQLTTPSVPAIDNNSQTVTIAAQDADGNTLIGGWFDANGNAVTMSVDTSIGSSVASFFKFTPASVSFAAPTSVMAYTSSGASSTQIQNGFTGVVWANPSNAATSGAANLTVSKPAITEFPIGTSNAYPEGITVGPDNASLWFAESNGNKIGTIAIGATPGTTTTDYGTGMSTFASPTNLASAGGKIWFTEFGIGKIGSIDPSSHTITEYKTPSCGSTCSTPDNPYGIVKGPDGDLWFTENCTTKSEVGTFAPSLPTGMQEYPTKTAGGAPQWITVGPDNNLWFTEPGGGSINKIGTMTTAGTANDFAVTPSGTIYSGGIVTGSDGALWFAECNPPGNAVGRITTAGSVTGQYALGTANSSPLGVATGPDGAIWFAENGNNAIGRIDPATHAIVEFSLPHANSNPWGITVAPDGALWFTECGPSGGNRIGRLQ